jgi:rubrerythrin
MGISNCRECGTLCVETPSGTCPRCQQEFFEAEDKVAEYLHLNKRATIESVHEATKVKKHIIMKMIRVGRIVEGELTYCCERCGVAITSGQFCPDCTTDALATLKSSSDRTVPEPEHNKNAGLHITELIEKLHK